MQRRIFWLAINNLSTNPASSGLDCWGINRETIIFLSISPKRLLISWISLTRSNGRVWAWSMRGVSNTIPSISFSHLKESFQLALKGKCYTFWNIPQICQQLHQVLEIAQDYWKLQICFLQYKPWDKFESLGSFSLRKRYSLYRRCDLLQSMQNFSLNKGKIT